jgi:hypothetical protein
MGAKQAIVEKIALSKGYNLSICLTLPIMISFWAMIFVAQTMNRA